MSVIFNLLKVLLALAIVVLGLWFTSDNPEMVGLTVFGFVLPEMKLGLWVLGTFLLGAILGVLACLGGRVRMATTIRQQARKLEKQIRQLENREAEIEQLKAERNSG